MNVSFVDVRGNGSLLCPIPMANDDVECFSRASGCRFEELQSNCIVRLIAKNPARLNAGLFETRGGAFCCLFVDDWR